MKNISKIAKEIIADSNLSKKFKEAIESYTGKKVKSLEYIEDPQVENTYAIRTDKKYEWLVVRYKPTMSTEELENILEETEFTKWPPVSGKLKFWH